MHRHKVAESHDRPYTGPIYSARRQVRAAHGGVTIVDRCACGAERRSNSNAGRVERGAWMEQADHDDQGGA